MGRLSNKAGAAALTLLSLCATAGFAQDANRGEDLYLHHCATCHGLDATGHGPMAGVLVIQPTNLKALQKDADAFPTARVVARIDGREPLVSHGSPMPVYGPYFEGRDVAIKAPDGQPIMTSRPIADLVAYLKTLQPS